MPLLTTEKPTFSQGRFYPDRMPQSFRSSFFRLPKISRPVVLALCVLLFFFYANPRRPSAQPAEIPSASASSGESNDAHAAEDYAATRSKLAKVTMLFYDEPNEESRAYESALLGHRKHDLRYGYRHFVLRQAIVEGMWSKQAYILSNLLQELAKPRTERLEWLLYVLPRQARVGSLADRLLKLA